MTYGLLDYLSSLVLPVLCMNISRRKFSISFVRTTPCHFDIRQLIIWVENFKDYISSGSEETQRTYLVPKLY